MFGTDHHSAFENWWQYAREHYVSWDDGRAVGLDLYYDPVVDEHVGHGPMGLIAPVWYFAPQRPEVARAGWEMVATVSGVLGDGPISGLDDPAMATMLLQNAGEFADASTRDRLWAAAEAHIEPTWDRTLGEFTLGFRLNEPYPRGQWNARSMAGWVCTQGAWSRIFNEPNLGKFEEPTVEGVDFPGVALSEARWDGEALHLAAHPQNDAVAGSETRMRVVRLPVDGRWRLKGPDRPEVEVAAVDGQLELTLPADNRPFTLYRH